MSHVLGLPPDPDVHTVDLGAALGISPAQIRQILSRRFELWSAHSGIEVDSHPFTFFNHAYLWPLFADRSDNIILMKAAQMGATVYMLLKAFHMALHHASWGFPDPVKIGFYFPEAKGIGRMVKDRVIPMMNSSPELRPYAKEQRQDMRPVGRSTIYFLYMGGQATKDSVPMNALFFDEVRLVKLADVFQAYARILHSWPYRYKHHVSTAGYPKDDIHKLFLNSDQKWFYTVCEACGFEQVLAEDFPDCIADHKDGPRKGQCYYICRKCRTELLRPQRGRYIARNPGHDASGYQISQLISQLTPPKDILFEFHNTSNIKDFHNSILGLPYVDKANKPLNEDMFARNVDPLEEWGEHIGTNFMGVDQMMGLNYVWVLNRIGDRLRVVWFEIIEDIDPWKRTAEIFERFQVQFCVADGLPNSNEALQFAQTYLRKVYLAYYGEYTDMVTWEDGKVKRGQKKARPGTVARYRVFLDSYKSVEYTISLIASAAITWPDPDRHVMECHPYAGGRRDYYPIMKTHAYPHFACPVRERVVTEEESGKFRMRWHYVGTDPHALHALNYAVFAAERKGGGFSFSF